MSEQPVNLIRSYISTTDDDDEDTYGYSTAANEACCYTDNGNDGNGGSNSSLWWNLISLYTVLWSVFVVLVSCCLFVKYRRTIIGQTIVFHQFLISTVIASVSMKNTGFHKSILNIPGPRTFPIIGTRWIFIKWFGNYRMNKLHEVYSDFFQRYGAVVKEEAFWNIPLVSINDRDSIEMVLKQSGKYPCRPPNEVTAYYRKSRPDRYTNLGLVNEQGATWHKLRTTLTPELTSKETMKKFLPELMVVAEDFVKLVDGSRDHNNLVRSFEELCNRLGLESTCTLILGKRFGFLQQKPVDETGKNLADAIRCQFRASRDAFYGIPFWKIFSTPAYVEFVSCENAIYDIISQLVETAIDNGNEVKCPTDNVHSVFRSILSAPSLDVRDKKAAIIDFIAAGIKTLGNTLVFMLYLIAKHPDIQRKLHDEIQSIIPSDCPITMNSLQNAGYLHACIMEAFRLLPTTPCLARILNQNTVLNGYYLPTGTVVLCHTRLACLEEMNFYEAKKFIPERWIDGVNNKSSFLVIPFGYGRRMCPGKRFVELELQVVVAQIIRNFEVSFKGEINIDFEFLLAPAPCTDFYFKPRL